MCPTGQLPAHVEPGGRAVERHGGAGRREHPGDPTPAPDLPLGGGVELAEVALVIPVSRQIGTGAERRGRSTMGRAKGGNQQDDRGDHHQQSSHGKNLAPDESLSPVA